jgi:hypothetical protein
MDLQTIEGLENPTNANPTLTKLSNQILVIFLLCLAP